ncbi:MAG: phosphate signaling complex protein PhoU [Candidatus Dormibacteraeota bacterium]|nr:phosphate signaling complex protein PhoU [Candidatus Dormibacteraeota bacterium]
MGDSAGVTPESFTKEVDALRESLLRQASLIESQIDDALDALRGLDPEGADAVCRNDLTINELFREIRERVFRLIATCQPPLQDLRLLMGFQYIATELERIGDYAVRISRRSSILAQLPRRPLQAEFGLMGELASQQVRGILDALIERDAEAARRVAGRDDEIDRLYHRVFDHLVEELGSGPTNTDEALRAVTLIQVAHNLERIGDRVTNVAEDIVFLESGQVVELG